MIYSVRHRSQYSYRPAVDLSHHVLHLTPRSLPYQRVIESHIWTTPMTRDLAFGVDYFGNGISFLSLTESHNELIVELEARVEVSPRASVVPGQTPPWEAVRDALCNAEPAVDPEIVEFISESPLAPFSDEVAAYAAPSFPAGRTLLDAVLDLTHRIHEDFAYDPNATGVTTPLAEVLERHRGVCQDFAHMEVAALRSMGLSARYVSGYVRTYGPAGSPRLAGADGSHAWVSVFCPGAGWIDVDPTNDLVVGEDHIVLAWGRDYDDISPIRGVILGGGEHRPAVGVDVTPLEM
jgi:transglutaminase-like putative cysteine protease